MLTDHISYPQSLDVPRDGWSHGQFPFPASGVWDEFAKFWEDLPVDAYVTSKHHTARYRRLGRVLARGDRDTNVVDIVPGASFFQSSGVNAVYGGQTRTFEPVPVEFFDSAQVRDIIDRNLVLVRDMAGEDADWLITFHLIRIVATGDSSSAPAPEGRHQDGHEYVIMHLIGRQDCGGGESRIYPCGSDEPVLRHTLTREMETLVLDDRTMQHEVSPIIRDGGDCAIRDMLIIDFDRVDDIDAFVTGTTIDLGTFQ